jgi:hypothetical protein
MADHHHEPATDHVHGTMNIEEHQRTFDGFVKFWVVVFGISIGILIFLALFNS